LAPAGASQSYAPLDSFGNESALKKEENMSVINTKNYDLI
jgi:hypothetical protein